MPDVVAVAEESPAIVVDDDFSRAFDQISVAHDAAKKLGSATSSTPEPVPVPTPEPGEDGLPPDDAQVAVAEAAAPPVAPTAPTAPPTAPAPTPPAAPQLSDDDIARRLASIVQRAQPAPTPAPQPQPEPSPFSEEDLRLVSEYQQEYPEIARAEAIQRRADILEAVKFVLSEMSRSFRPTVDRTAEMYQRMHVGDVQRLVPDYNITREQAISWVNSQPTYLRPAYMQVIQQGTPEEVADFTARYRASQPGAVQPPVQQPPAQPVVQQPPRRVLAALAPVQSKRSGITADAISPDDFDGAFERFARLADQRK